MVNDTLSLFKFLHANKLFVAVKVFADQIFVICISSALFEKFYFKYELLSFTDYKAIFNFFIKGEFIVPFSVFFIVWLCTFLFAFGIFSLVNQSISKKWVKKIHSKRFISKKKIKDIDKGAKNTKGIKISDRFGDKWYVALYNRIKASITPQQVRKIQNDFSKAQRSAASHFNMIFRGLIAVLIFFNTVPHFGWILFSVLMICFILYSVILVFIYQFTELMPEVVRKIDIEMQEYINSESKGD